MWANQCIRGTLENNVVKESKEKVKKKKKKRNKTPYIVLLTLLIISILGIILYLNKNTLKCYLNKCINPPIEIPEDTPKEVINHPTTQYVFDSAFMFKLNNLWNEKNEKNYSYQIKKIVFEKNTSTFKITKYRFKENTLNSYLNYIGIETSNQIENNNTKYEHITNNETEEYIVIQNEYIYVLTFTDLNNEEINEIMKTIYYYK